MAVVGQEFWIVAGKAVKGDGEQAPNADKQTMYQMLEASNVFGARAKRVGNRSEYGPWKFQVPDGEPSLVFGSFDNLIRLTDELAKVDSSVDTIVHRIERQWLEIDPKADFMVKSQHQVKTFSEYLSTWEWSEERYPKSRAISDNLAHLVSTVNKLDENARTYTLQYSDAKTQKANIAKKDGASLLNRDLVDVVIPSVVRCSGDKDDDFIQTEHLTTVFVILARGADKEFLEQYETYAVQVVPGSAKKFNLDDKDGNSLWRVVLFKSSAEDFKKRCRELRLAPRDFEYSEEAYTKLIAQREASEQSVQKYFANLRNIYQAAWSDVMIAWIHVKAMRVFVESVLRFGMPAYFGAFIVVPAAGTQVTARKQLATQILNRNMQGDGSKEGDTMGDDGEDYYPYVSFSFMPFTAPRSA